jgi:hypothetical protein
MKRFKKTMAILPFMVCCCLCLHAQEKKSNPAPDYKNHPHWVQMMGDSSVNYFEAVKAFNEFWKDRKEPVEDDVIVDGKPQEEEEWTAVRKLLHRKEYREEKIAEEYRFEHKKFKHWQLVVEPFVQPDGRILSAEERLEIWRQQRQ